MCVQVLVVLTLRLLFWSGTGLLLSFPSRFSRKGKLYFGRGQFFLLPNLEVLNSPLWETDEELLSLSSRSLMYWCSRSDLTSLGSVASFWVMNRLSPESLHRNKQTLFRLPLRGKGLSSVWHVKDSLTFLLQQDQWIRYPVCLVP